MPITTDDLNSFHHFAITMVTKGQAPLTLAELVEHWQRDQELAAANASISQSLAEFEARQGEPVREFLDKMKSKYNLTLDSKR